MKFFRPKLGTKLDESWLINESHLITGNVTQLTTPNIGEEIELTKPPLFIVLHYTATLDAVSANAILCDKDKEVSAHLVIDRDGQVYQLVPFNRIAWHAGQSEWEGLTGLNKYSIGIELVNAGKVEREGRRFITWDRKDIAKRDVIKVEQDDGFVSYWQHYPRKQLDVLEDIMECIKSKYQVSHVLMHSEISPGRKIDPGLAFPIGRFRV